MKIKIYTLSTCVYCLLSKNLLKEKNIIFEEINLEENIDIFEDLKNRYNYSKVPMIFIDDKFIGGYQELKEYFKIYKFL